jgi:hypothetical protein
MYIKTSAAIALFKTRNFFPKGKLALTNETHKKYENGNDRPALAEIPLN